MPSRYLGDAETAYRRTVLLAVELRDVVSLLPVTRQVRVTAVGLDGPGRLNASGRFVWLEEGAHRAERIRVDPGSLPYDSEDVAVPPMPPDLDTVPEADRLLRVWLRPARGYPFPDDVTLVRGQLDALDAEVWLEWQDEATQDWRHAGARTFARTRAGGAFAAFLRPAPGYQPAVGADGLMPARLAVARAGSTRHTAPFSLREGRTLASFQQLAWDALT